MVKIAVENIENWIFVTGVPRSGTTFVGKVLSLPLEVDFINEPFRAGKEIPDTAFKYRYLRHDADDQLARAYHEAIQRIQRYDFSMRTWSPRREPWYIRMMKRTIGSRGPFYLRLAKINPLHKAAVIKSPQKGLLAEYLYTHFNIKPVIVVKHPVSVIASLKRVNWCPRLSWFHQQAALVEDFFADDQDFLLTESKDIAQAGAAHWRAFYKVLLSQAQKYPAWQVVLLEEVSQTPLASFQRLYEALDLPWSEAIARKISRMTSADSTRARGNRVHDLKRNSAQIFETYRDSISLEERRAIFEIVGDVALQVYSRESFAID